MKRLVRKLIAILSYLGLIIGVFVFLGAAIDYHDNIICKGFSISIDHGKGNFFIERKDIEALLFDDPEYSGLLGEAIKNIDFSKIELLLEDNCFIDNAEIYANALGKVKIDIKQREPIVRVINNRGVSYYIDKNGEKMPISTKFTARLMVATGKISDNGLCEGKIEHTIVKKIFKLAKFINSDPFWLAQIEQLNINEAGSFELIPKVGNHYILFGDIDDMEMKFRKLMTFYKEILKSVGWNQYREINLKYKGQIVCSKTLSIDN